MKKIALWVGSSPTSKANLQKGLQRLRQLGLEFVFPASSQYHATRAWSKDRAFLAGPDKLKVENFAKLWARDDIQDILCLRGGYGAIRLLPHLDKIKLKGKPKRIWGFSDLTVLQHYLYQRFGCGWVHSHMLTSPSFQKPIGAEREYWLSDAEKLVQTLQVLHCETPRKYLKAPLIGGNLACLTSLVGTPWEPKPKKNFILFLEDLNEPSYKLDRLLQQLLNSEMMRNCQTVVLGHFTKCQGYKALFKYWAEENGISVYSGVMAGHQRPNVPLVMGLAAELIRKKSGDYALVTSKVNLAC